MAGELFVRSWPALARAHIAVRGAIDAECGAELLRTVAAVVEPDMRIAIDLSDVAAIDAAGVQAIRRCAECVVGRGAEFVTQDPSPAARAALAAAP